MLDNSQHFESWNLNLVLGYNSGIMHAGLFVFVIKWQWVRKSNIWLEFSFYHGQLFVVIKNGHILEVMGLWDGGDLKNEAFVDLFAQWGRKEQLSVMKPMIQHDTNVLVVMMIKITWSGLNLIYWMFRIKILCWFHTDILGGC